MRINPKINWNYFTLKFLPNSFYFQRNTNYFKTAFLCCYSISFKQYNTNSKKCAAHMRINPHRDTFFNLINFKTASKTQKSKTASSPKQNNTKIPKNKAPKPKAHHKNSTKHKANVFTAVYQKPDNSTAQKSKPNPKTPQIKKSCVYKIA